MLCRRLSRPQAGQQIVELAVGLIVLLPIVLALVDLAIIITAVQVNDAAARDAARVAAAGRPTQTEIDNRVNQVCSQAYQSSGYITGPTKVSARAVDVSPDPNAPSPFGGPYSGTVRVETKINVKVPAYVPGLMQDNYDFNSRQEFPITFVEPNTAQPL